MEIGGKQLMLRGTGRVYRIVVRSELGDACARAREGMEMEATGGYTLLEGKIVDQPHLYGILAQRNASLVGAVPFVAATVFIAALPVLSYLLFRRRAQQVMPKVRDWMNKNSWLVNIIVYVVFILLILF
jgi:hypothetical protein